MTENQVHAPVMANEVLEFLAPRPGDVMIDLTVGAGGHAARILERVGQTGRVIGIDRDPNVLEVARRALEPFGDRAVLEASNFDGFRAILGRLGISKVQGVLMDLGVSSLQIDDPDRGFSFQREGPLDMRMTTGRGRTALEVLEESSEAELERILRDYGEEPFARKLAHRLHDLCRHRPPRTTTELASFVASLVPPRLRGRSRVHPATRVFQALRIAVNDELGALERTLPRALEALTPGGRLAVIAFHSLEDRLVKSYFHEQRRLRTIEVLTRKPVRPSEAEIARNPRSRSAKLRVAEKLSADHEDGGALDRSPP